MPKADETGKVVEIDALSTLKKHAYRKQLKGAGNGDNEAREGVVNLFFMGLQPDLSSDHGLGRTLRFGASVESTCRGAR